MCRVISSCKEDCGCSCGSGYGCGYGYGHGVSWLWLLLLVAGEQMPHSDTGVIFYKQTNDIGSSSFYEDHTRISRFMTSTKQTLKLLLGVS